MAKRLRHEQLDAANAAAAAAAARQTQLATVGAHSSGSVQVGLLERWTSLDHLSIVLRRSCALSLGILYLRL